MGVLTRKERGRRLCDQKANSVADIAAVLGLPLPGGNAVEAAEGAETKTAAPSQIVVKWSDILDAEFAPTWPDGVVHDVLEPEPRYKRRSMENGELY